MAGHSVIDIYRASTISQSWLFMLNANQRTKQPTFILLCNLISKWGSKSIREKCDNIYKRWSLLEDAKCYGKSGAGYGGVSTKGRRSGPVGCDIESGWQPSLRRGTISQDWIEDGGNWPRKYLGEEHSR